MSGMGEAISQSAKVAQTLNANCVRETWLLGMPGCLHENYENVRSIRGSPLLSSTTRLSGLRIAGPVSLGFSPARHA